MADKAALIGEDRLGDTATVEVSKKIGSVTVRAVPRAAAIRAYAAAGAGDLNQYEVILLAAGITDPALTEEEVQQWRGRVKAREVKPVMDKILELSEMGQDSNPKDALPGATAPSPSA